MTIVDGDNKVDLLIGLGEVGQPLSEIIGAAYPIITRDIEPIEIDEEVGVLHICYPYDSDTFASTTGQYVAQYSPDLTIIHSTVAPGTTAWISDQTQAAVAYSPVRGKHSRMLSDLKHYTKFVSGSDSSSRADAAKHLEGAGFTVRPLESCAALELAKLVETTYFGLLIAWAQEVERYSKELDVLYEDVLAFTEEVEFLPRVMFMPGYIGGHCVIPNTYLLEKVKPSDFLDVIRLSNQTKEEEWIAEGRDLTERSYPKPILDK